MPAHKAGLNTQGAGGRAIMSITLDSLVAWMYRLRGIRIAGSQNANTKSNPSDDVTRLRNAHHDEIRLQSGRRGVDHLEAAHAQRHALRDRINIL
jgi:hypothetical protein